MMTLSKLALPILLIAILFLLITGNLLSRSPFVIVAQLAALALMVWARRSFNANQFSIHAEPREGQLLSSGPYRFIRHPMYAGALLLIWSSVFGHWSLLTLIVGLVVTAVVALRIQVEEQALRLHYPGYADYARQTRRIIPFVI